MSINPIILAIPVYFILIVIEWTTDLILKKDKYRFGDVIGNIGCGLTEQLTGIFAKIGVIAIYTFIYSNFRITTIAHEWYWAVVLFIGVDFFYYWAHRKSHEISLFWVGHIVHHQSEDYNFSVALRQGTFQKFFTAPFFWPLAILGFDPVWFLFIGAFVTVYQFWIHTEYIDKMGWFEWVFNTPSHHRVHHGRDPEYIDKNHGGTLIIWDRMFGTFKEETVTPNYGVTEQLKTYNPINATLIPVIQILKKVTLYPKISDKFKSLFLGPGWVSSSEKSTTTVINNKYNPKLSKNKIIYVAIVFMELLVLSSFILFQYKSMVLTTTLALVTLALITIWTLGNIVDGKFYGVKTEVIRVFILLVVVISLWLLLDVFSGKNMEIMVFIFLSTTPLFLLLRKNSH
jgi:sterol desaturase/sphingolipid hydroxylase (fatty acid hydroxylase superfamily)